MGLDIVCRCGKIDFRAGSYSGFHAYRMWVAKKLGLPVMELGAIGEYPQLIKGMPFEDFFNHSDCDGKLTYRQCKRLLPQFLDFLEKVRKEYRKKLLQQGNLWDVILGSNSMTDEDYCIRKTETWIDALQHCIENRCELYFC